MIKGFTMDEIINEIATIEIKTKKYYTDANFNELDNCDFIGISNQENLYKDLEMLLKFLKSSIKEEYIFKWIIIAMHNILIEFMLAAIRGDSWRSVIRTDKNGNEKIISIIQLYDKYVENSKHESVINNNDKRRNLLIQLIDIRNNFIHPFFDYELIDKTLIKKMLYNAVDIIEEIVINIESTRLITDKTKKVIIKIKKEINKI